MTQKLLDCLKRLCQFLKKKSTAYANAHFASQIRFSQNWLSRKKWKFLPLRQFFRHLNKWKCRVTTSGEAEEWKGVWSYTILDVFFLEFMLSTRASVIICLVTWQMELKVQKTSFQSHNIQNKTFLLILKNHSDDN